MDLGLLVCLDLSLKCAYGVTNRLYLMPLLVGLHGEGMMKFS